MKIEDFNKKLIENIFLASNPACPFDNTLFLDQSKEEINQICRIGDFDIIHIELPEENILCDGYAIDENKGVLSILIGDVTKNKDQIETISEEDVELLIEKGKNFVKNIFEDKLLNLIDQSEEDQYSAIDEIYETSLRIESINFYVVTNKTYFSEHDLIDDGFINKIKCSSMIISLIDFFELWKSKSQDFITPNIDFRALGYRLPFISLPLDYEEYNGHLVMMNAKALFDIYEEHETDLLQSNVRFFLNATRKQNKGLLETLGGDDRQKFFAYNNGISATANSVQFFEEDGISYIKTVDNFQIVNGGQTTATIHFFGKKDKNNLKLLEDVYIQMKLNVIKNSETQEDFVHDISRYANTQSAVSFSDLDANDSFNAGFEKYSRSISIPKTHGEKWFFERKTGEYFTTGLNLSRNDPNAEARFQNEFKKNRVVKKTELALLLFAWGFVDDKNNIEPRPYDSALGAEKNYTKFKKYKTNNFIKIDERFYSDSISKIIMARKIALLVNKAGIKQQRNHVVNYTLGLMSLKCNGVLKFGNIWDNQDISEELSESLYQLVKKVWKVIQESAGPINLGTWCRKAECWLEVKKIHHSFSKKIPEIISNGQVDEISIIQNKKPDTICEISGNVNGNLTFDQSLEDSGFWFSLAKWSKENEVLDGRSRKFIFQVGTYISRNFNLTEKQLKWAEKCFEEACSKGYNQKDQKNGEKVYLKLITPQDIERTPSLSRAAAEDYFNLNIDNGESKELLFIYNGEKYEIEINKRNTRNEYRFFLNRFRHEINYDIDDILIFGRENESLTIDILRKNQSLNSNSRYAIEHSKMEGKYHVLS